MPARPVRLMHDGLPDRDAIAALLPHAGRMCLLHRVVAWDAAGIECEAISHLAPNHPLLVAGALPMLCGLEYPLQAAALHGALTGGGTRCQPGYVASVRDVALYAARLDDPTLGAVRATARLEQDGPGGASYALELRSQAGQLLLRARVLIAFGAEP